MNRYEGHGTFTIIGDDGNEVVCDILFTLDSKETGKSYIVYTDNTVDGDGCTKVFASVYDPTGKDTCLMPVETEKEWQIIEAIIEELQNDTDIDETDENIEK